MSQPTEALTDAEIQSIYTEEQGMIAFARKIEAEILARNSNVFKTMLLKLLSDPEKKVNLLEIMDCGHYLANMDYEKDACVVCEERNRYVGAVVVANHALKTIYSMNTLAWNAQTVCEGVLKDVRKEKKDVRQGTIKEDSPSA